MKYPADEFVDQLVLGRYRIVGVLAKGGMGVIYLARSEGAGGFIKPVVVKRILSGMDEDHTMVEMFKREARIMSNLRHPGVVSVIDFGRDLQSYFMVLDYVHGFHLGRWLRFMNVAHGPFPLAFALHIIIQVLDALHYAHTLAGPDGKLLQVVHRDVTPSNVLIDVEGHVKLADFGIARMRTDATEAGSGETKIKGKFSYLPPELLQGAEPSPASDVYGAAVVLHEILCGKNVFRAPNLSTTISRVISHIPEPLDQIRDDVSAQLGAVVARALHKDPSQRFPTALEFAQVLRSMRPENVEMTQPKLAAAVARDFFDQRMAELLNVDSLAMLDKTWRDVGGPRKNTATYASSRPPAPLVLTAPVRETPKPVPRQPVERPRKPEPMAPLVLAVQPRAARPYQPQSRPEPRAQQKILKIWVQRMRERPIVMWTTIGVALMMLFAIGGLTHGLIGFIRRLIAAGYF